MAKKILILGGGTGGYIALRGIHKAKEQIGLDAEVTMLTASPWHDFQPLYADLAFGMVDRDKIRASVENFKRLGARIVVDRATRIDAANRLVHTEAGDTYPYDYLVVSLGTKYGWDAYPGLEQAGVHNYTMEAAEEMRRELARFKGGKVVVLVPETPHRCGMYPYEAATHLAETFKNRGAQIEVKLLSPGEMPLGPLGHEISRAWRERMERVGVEYVPIKGLEEIDLEKKVVRAGNVEEKYDLLIKVPPSRLPDVLEQSEGFQWKMDGRFAPVKGYNFRHPDYDDVYMVGEHSMPPAGLPTAGIPVHYAAEVAANSIVADMVGAYPVYMPRGMIPCIGYYGLSAFAGFCEVRYNESEGRRVMKCYSIARSPLIRILKQAFYESWISAIKMG
ncbi:MAG: NAD(P)/FAD-dependent oxidoreductase [Desulfurococcales archaeon]|nr:NAD(P)/FAD-dependent oxidoreductase [Desulfurococcales archaeon]MCE4605638.1 NAD(P)/FAD-dependent oxidoreductase [Desulfurococcales archaeon]